MTFKDAAVGLRVRQQDWLLRPTGHRDGSIVEVLDAARGTPHGWVMVEFDPQPYKQGRHVLRVSTAQLERLAQR